MAVPSYMLDTKHMYVYESHTNVQISNDKFNIFRNYEIIEYGQFLTQASDNGSP